MSDYDRAILQENVVEAIRDHAEIVVAHDAIHPDRDVCGGVGGCVLMRAEYDAKTAVIARLEQVARLNTGGFR